MRKVATTNVILTFIVFSVIMVSSIMVYTTEQIRQQTETIELERLVTINLIASKTELRIDSIVRTLQITSNDDAIKEAPDASLIDKSLHGIPEYQETNKRTPVHNVIDFYNDFESILYVLPNGDAYFVEPYSSQQALTVSNFSFRGWYKNVINTHDSYVSSIIISKATNNPITVVAVPVISQDGSLRGILAGALKLNAVQKVLNESRSYPNERILMVDNERNIIADTAGFHEAKVYLGIGAIAKALAGERGTIIGTIDGTKMFVAYAPIEVSQNRWVIVSIQPYDDALHSVNLSRNELTFLIIAISSLFTITGYFLYRSSVSREKFAQKLEQLNEFLKRTQSTLVMSEERYRNLFQLSPDPTIVVNREGTILSYNESFEKKFGYSKDVLAKKNIRDITDKMSKESVDEYFKELEITGHLDGKEVWYKKKDGASFPTLVSASILRDKNNAFAGYIGVLKDITELYEAKRKIEESEKIMIFQLDKLQEIDKLKDEFSSMVSHELKTPLFPIKFHSEMLMDQTIKGALNKIQLESAKEIYQNATKLERLIDDILISQKLELKKLTFDISDVEVDRLINEVMKQNAPLMVEKQIEFVNSNMEKITIKSDPARLSQVFWNLIKNSVDFVPDKGGIIEVGAQSNREDIVFYVKDNGIGIPKEKQQNLFKKFYQIDTSYKRKHGGTGLGLSICKGIIEGLEGKIWVESSPGMGTTLYFSIPKRSN